ncbi:DUF4097 domain-containing protein [Deinococcus sp. Marseille-Q6407]|uniref:DUF4097 domain-containing protein n=1 Tax=Deinococcus sp. Marseille-Q6407 TaxID=2969223 RepID=UPI0021BFBDC3|nr:DUF4097 domain-containing protein [Deinococcus sp. Marseille-Q6407]
MTATNSPVPTNPKPRPHARPLGPVLGRLLLGLALLAGGGAAAWTALNTQLAPALSATDTAQAVPLGGARTLNASLTTDRAEVQVGALPPTTQGQAAGLAFHHRQLNSPQVTATRQGDTLNLQAQLLVDPAPKPNTINLQPQGQQVEHRLAAQLSPGPALDLSTRSGGGEQQLDLQTLALHSLHTHSTSGPQTVQLPAGQTGEVALESLSGALTLSAPAGHATAIDTLSAESRFGNLQARLHSAQVGRLTLTSQLGDIEAQLPAHNDTALTTAQGDLDVTLPPGASGQLRLQAERGSVTLNLPATAAFRLSFSRLSNEQTRMQASHLPKGMLYQNGSFLSPAAQAPGRAPVLEISLDLPIPNDLSLNLLTPQGATQP